MEQFSVDRLTDAVALGAVTSPLWFVFLSDYAAMLLPLAGLVWLAVQIIDKIRKWRND